MFSRVLESTTELGRKNRMAPESLQRWRGKGKDTRQVRTEMSLFIEIRTKEGTTGRFCDRKNIYRN